MRRRTKIYWAAQISGWGLFVLGNVLSASFVGQKIEGLYLVSAGIFFVGIITTHLFRWVIHRLGWKRLSIAALVPLILISVLAMSVVFTSINTAITDLMAGEIPLFYSSRTAIFWQNMLNFSALFLLWSILYFAVNTFENWKKEEILNLELRAAKTEIELNSFKSQMNPHFMFNALNSIRALVEENPEKAKQAITMLSGILRSNLTMGKQQTVPLSEELDMVEKYLALEKIRFEERLQIIKSLHPDAVRFRIPPFMLQTIIENALKHGIAKRMDGGTISLLVDVKNDILNIKVVNSGYYDAKEKSEGIGLANTSKRLALIYGDQASFEIKNVGEEVIAELCIPKLSEIK